MHYGSETLQYCQTEAVPLDREMETGCPPRYINEKDILNEEK
jgi:hypothetical protein